MKNHSAGRHNIAIKICIAFIAYCIVHMYCMTNLITNHDDVAIRYYNYYDMTYLGRWALYFINKITLYTLNTNWSCGILTCFCVSVGIGLIAKMLSFKNTISEVIAIFLMVSFPTVASWNLYTWTSLGYSIGFMTAIAAAYVLYETYNAEKKSIQIIGTVIGCVLLSLSLGCYQAFVCIYFVLVWYKLLVQLLKEGIKKKDNLLLIFYGVISFVTAYIVYIVTLKIMLKLRNAELTGYQGVSEMGKITFWGTLNSIKLSYIEFVKYYSEAYSLNGLRLLNILLFLGLILLGIFCIFKSKNKLSTNLLIVALIALMPPVINSIYILTQGASNVYSCMYYTYIFPYLFMLKLLETYIQDASKRALPYIASGIIAFSFFLVSNRAYANQDAVFNTLQQYFNRVAMRIESTEGFCGEETKVYYANPISIIDYPYFQGSGLDTTDTLQHMVYNDTGLHTFMRYYLGFNTDGIEWDEEKINQILDSKEFENMEVYPSARSIQFINDVLVVKFK